MNALILCLALGFGCADKPKPVNPPEKHTFCIPMPPAEPSDDAHFPNIRGLIEALTLPAPQGESSSGDLLREVEERMKHPAPQPHRHRRFHRR